MTENVVQGQIQRFAHGWKQAGKPLVLPHRARSNGPIDQGLMSDADISGARECNRAEEISDFIDEEHAGPLTGAIDHSPARRNRIVTGFSSGQDNRDSRSYRPMTDGQLAGSGYQR